MSGGRHTKAEYAKHYREYQGTPEQIKNRAQRNAAREEYEKKHGDQTGKDIDHKKPIRSGGGNKGNLRAVAPGKNRGWRS